MNTFIHQTRTRGYSTMSLLRTGTMTLTTTTTFSATSTPFSTNNSRTPQSNEETRGRLAATVMMDGTSILTTIGTTSIPTGRKTMPHNGRTRHMQRESLRLHRNIQKLSDVRKKNPFITKLNRTRLLMLSGELHQR